jgi:predicted GNAT superfamily acetyltransferase
MSTTAQTRITIRDIERIAEMRDVEELQKEAWGFDDRDVVPFSTLVATNEVGGILVGAFDGDSLVGFVYGFVGRERGHQVIHSHMLAVKPGYQSLGLGYKLKLAQRERAIAQGIARITWTFDPLQSRNAYFNFGKLGVIADQYKINFYGEETSSFLHRGMGTDRLWVSWLVESRRVKELLGRGSRAEDISSELERTPPLVKSGAHGSPRRNETSESFGGERAFVEIPGDISPLQQRNTALAVRWREATRWAYTKALASGYIVQEFYRLTRSDQQLGVYLLSPGKKIEDFAE